MVYTLSLISADSGGLCVQCLDGIYSLTISNSGTPASDPPVSFSCCGDGGTEPASYCVPRTACHRHDEERCDQHPLPSRTGLLSDILRTADEPEGTVFWLSAIWIHNLCPPRTALPPDVKPYVFRSTWSQQAPGPDNLDACMGPSVL